MAADVIEGQWKPKGTPFLRRERLLVFGAVLPIYNYTPSSLRCKTAFKMREIVRLSLPSP